MDRVDAWIDYVVKIFDELTNPPGQQGAGLERGSSVQ